MKQAHFLASFLFSILFLLPEFSLGQAPPSSHTSKQALSASRPLGPSTSQLSDSSLLHGAPSQGCSDGHGHSWEWDDCREGSPRGQRESRRKQQPFFFVPLGELITGQQPTAQVSAWDQPPAHQDRPLSFSWEGAELGMGEGARGETLPTSSSQGP